MKFTIWETFGLQWLCIVGLLQLANWETIRLQWLCMIGPLRLRERLVNVEGRCELAKDLATLYMDKANAVSDQGDNQAACGSV